MLPDEAIEEYRKIYWKSYKTKISLRDAQEQATNLFEFFKAIYKPIPLRRGKSGKEGGEKYEYRINSKRSRNT